VFSSNCAGVALGAVVTAVAGGGAGVTTAEGADTKGVPLAKGAADEGAGATAGGGSGCRAIQISQAISPRTQRVMAIHAVRSINYSRLLTRRRSSAPVNLPPAPDQIRCHPGDDIAAGALFRESSRARRRALRPLARNIRSTWAKNGSQTSLRRGTKAPVKALSDNRE